MNITAEIKEVREISTTKGLRIQNLVVKCIDCLDNSEIVVSRYFNGDADEYSYCEWAEYVSGGEIQVGDMVNINVKISLDRKGDWLGTRFTCNEVAKADDLTKRVEWKNNINFFD